MAECLLCVPHAQVPDEEILDHLRLFHPGAGEGPPAWPGNAIQPVDVERGACCPGCGRVFALGERYETRLITLIGGIPVTEVVCLACDTADPRVTGDLDEGSTR